MRRLILLLMIAAGSGCYGSEGYAVSASVAAPSSANLVYVGNGVYAVAGYEEPIFYANDYYWRYTNGYWYRAPRLGYGWSYYARPPRVIARIDRPYYTHRRYIEYRHRPAYRGQTYRQRPHTYQPRTYQQRTYQQRTYRAQPRTQVHDRRTYQGQRQVHERDHRRQEQRDRD